MKAEEIKAQIIGEHLFGAVGKLREAKRLISEMEHTSAWANVTIAIENADQAIRMLRQDYTNMDKAVLASKFKRAAK